MLKKKKHDLELCTVIKRPLLMTDMRRKREYAIALIGLRVQFKIRCIFDLAWTSQVYFLKRWMKRVSSRALIVNIDRTPTCLPLV